MVRHDARRCSCRDCTQGGDGVSADLLKRLIEAGTPAELIAEVAMLAGEAAALERRRESDRERQAARRHVMSRDTADVTDTAELVSPIENNLTPSGTSLPDEASASSPVRQQIGKAEAIWNKNATEAGWPMVRSLSPNRCKLLSARLREHGIDGWTAAIAKARASPYLAGADPPSWFSFPWLIKAENFLKLIEGNYDRNRSQPDHNPTRTAVERIIGSQPYG